MSTVTVVDLAPDGARYVGTASARDAELLARDLLGDERPSPSHPTYRECPGCERLVHQSELGGHAVSCADLLALAEGMLAEAQEVPHA